MKKKLAESKVYRNRRATDDSVSPSSGSVGNDDRQQAAKPLSSSIALPRGSLAPLPISIRRLILDYCSAVEDAFLEDLVHLENVVTCDELAILNAYHPSAATAPQQPSEGATPPSPPLASRHPLLAIVDSVEHEVHTLYEGRIMHELAAYARCFGVKVCSSYGGYGHRTSPGESAPQSPTTGSTRRRSQVTYAVDERAATACATPPPSAIVISAPHTRGASPFALLSSPTSQQQRRMPSTTNDETLSFFQRDVVAAAMGRIYGQARAQRDRFERALSWVHFREGMLHSTCAALRPIIRDDLLTWEAILQQWRTPNQRCCDTDVPGTASSIVRGQLKATGPHVEAGSRKEPLDPEHVDVMFERALMELTSYQRRVSSVEYLGRDDLTLDDVRNHFWEVGLAPPPPLTCHEVEDVTSATDGGSTAMTTNGVTEAYAQSITFRQALTLGLTEIPWVRGYSWEDRVTAAAMLLAQEEGEGDDKHSLAAYSGVGARSPRGGAATADMFDAVGSDSGRLSPQQRTRSPLQQLAASSSNNPLNHQLSGRQSPNAKSRSVCSVARSERVLQMLGNHGVDDAVRQQLEELERERAVLEAADQALRRKAFSVAAHAMSQRLWLSTDLFRPHGEHRFAGCEYCADTHLAMVGLKRENSGAMQDIVVCASCYQDLYADELSIAHRMFQWLTVQELIGAGVTSVGEEGGASVVGGENSRALDVC